MKYLDKYIVVCKWVEETDLEWVNWVWCIAGNGMTGWVPIQILNVCETLPNERQIAIALEDYSAYELPVNQDEIVIGSRCLNGWLWCRKENSTKKGWVPIRCLKRSIESL